MSTTTLTLPTSSPLALSRTNSYQNQQQPPLTPQATTPNTRPRPSYFRSLSSTATIPILNTTTSTLLKTNKPRLYLALYPRGTGCTSSFSSSSHCDSFHFSLLVGPQTCSRKDPGTRYHVAHSDDSDSRGSLFVYEERDIRGPPALSDETTEGDDEHNDDDPVNPSHKPRNNSSDVYIPSCRIALAKVRDPARLDALIRSVPLPNTSHGHGQGHSSETCRDWTRRAFETIFGDAGSRAACLSTYLKANEWEHVEAKARKYYKRKRDQRRWNIHGEDGDDYHHGPWDPGMVATWNFWENREIAA